MAPQADEAEQFDAPDDSVEDEELLALRRQVALTSQQLQECVSSDERLVAKLTELNGRGCDFIQRKDFKSAVVFLSEAERLLEHAANYGKTIERSLIITTLNNEACVYQRLWELETSANYIEAVIYNLNSYLEAFPEIEFIPELKDPKSVAYADLSIYITRKISLAVYMLQYCAVSSQNKNHTQAYSSAVRTVDILREICDHLSKFGHYCQKLPKNDVLTLLTAHQQVSVAQTQAILQRALKGINRYTKAIQNGGASDGLDLFKTYSIGHLMQIEPTQITKSPQLVNLRDELNDPKKTMKAVYVSIAYFTMATELRYISLEKHTLDEAERKQSHEYKESHVFHLMSIITIVEFLQCQSAYFGHIIKSYKNHYEVDLLKQSEKYEEVSLPEPKRSVIEHKQQPDIPAQVLKTTSLSSHLSKKKAQEDKKQQPLEPNRQYFGEVIKKPKKKNTGGKSSRKMTTSTSKNKNGISTSRSKNSLDNMRSTSKEPNRLKSGLQLHKVDSQTSKDNNFTQTINIKKGREQKKRMKTKASQEEEIGYNKSPFIADVISPGKIKSPRLKKKVPAILSGQPREKKILSGEKLTRKPLKSKQMKYSKVAPTKTHN